MTDNETRGLGLAPATAGDYRELARRAEVQAAQIGRAHV